VKSSGSGFEADSRQAAREAESFSAIVQTLGNVDIASLSARDVDLVARAVARFPSSESVRIAFLGNHTVEPLPRYVTVAAAARGLGTTSQVGRYNQFMQDVLDLDAETVRFDPQLLFLSLSLRTLAPRVFFEFLALSTEEKKRERERILDLFRDWIGAAKTTTKATLLIANPVRPIYLQAGLADNDLESSEAGFYRDLDADLQQLCRGDGRAFLFDLDRTLSASGKAAGHDPKLYYLAKMEWSESALPAIAHEIARYVHALRRPARKCLVLDLDDTLWGGVVGEDGARGLKVGPGDPVGEAFSEIQQLVLGYKQRGVLLALCSKNNESDAREAFQERPEMPLSWEDFTVTEVNWSPKHESLGRIAESLQIGTDALVFVDDNPVECDLVRNMLPEVCTVELSGEPSTRPDRLRSLTEFDQLHLTAEDLEKSSQYAASARRESDRNSAGDLQSFLESLETTVLFGEARPSHLDRVHQLFTKTNQFNLTTQRYDRGEVERFWEDEKFDLLVGRVSDRFGDLGLVVVCLVELRGAEARLDSFILSCRVMGRGVETSVINTLKNRYLLDGGMGLMTGSFDPTSKNMPVETLYETQGFTLLEDGSETGRKSYRLLRDDARVLPCPGITTESIEEN